MGQQLTLSGCATTCQENNSQKTKRTVNHAKPIELQKIPNLEELAQKITLKENYPVVGVYKQMGVDEDATYVCFEQDGDLFVVSFPKRTKEEEIIRKSFRCVKHNLRIRIRKLDNPDTPLEVQKIPNFKNSFTLAKSIALIAEEKVLGAYLDLQKDFDEVHLILELVGSRKIVRLSFPKNSIETQIIKLALSKVKHKVRLEIGRTNDEDKPIAIRTIRNNSTKGNSLHLDEPRLKIIEQYCDRTILKLRKRWLAAISTMDYIIKNKQLIVAVVADGKVKCNKMQNTGEINRPFCSHFGVPTSQTFCIDHCPIGKEFLKLRDGGT